MVVFECSKCNETLKKPKVEQHLWSCGSGFVTCIDCNKTFSWDNWQAHTTCISEAQKYQGNLYQAKEKENKGQAKQDTWVDNVQQKIEDPASNIAPNIRSLLQKLMGFSNIPRKQKPFGNFVKNSLKIWNDKDINAMWDVISSANAKPPAAAPAAANAAQAPAAPAAAPACCNHAGAENKQEEATHKKWAGWKRALDDELESAKAPMSWKRVRDVLVERFRENGEGKGASDEDLGFQALANIPAEYLSKEDEFVRQR